MRSSAIVFLIVASLALGSGCRSPKDRSDQAAAPTATRELIAKGQFDEAIASLGAASDADSLCLLGQAWAGKARTAPLPTAAPGSPAAVAPLKPEEETALGFFERAVAERPDHAEAHLGIAELLAPHALAQLSASSAALGRPGASGAVGQPFGVERILRSYGDAVQADPAGTVAVERLISFAVAAGRLAEADGAYQELLRRRREDPDLLVRYGDFLAGPRGNPDGAISPYAQALIWRSDDATTRTKMAEIHLHAAEAHLGRNEYVGAETRLREAQRLKLDPSSSQAERLAALQRRLSEIRWR